MALVNERSDESGSRPTTGRSGERVTSSPAGIKVNVGSTGSASFNVVKSITLKAERPRCETVGGLFERRQQADGVAHSRSTPTRR
jgi:hypothetical protein